MGRFVVGAIPYYSVVKGLVLVYCFHPKTKVSASSAVPVTVFNSINSLLMGCY